MMLLRCWYWTACTADRIDALLARLQPRRHEPHSHDHEHREHENNNTRSTAPPRPASPAPPRPAAGDGQGEGESQEGDPLAPDSTAAVRFIPPHFFHNAKAVR